MRCRPAPFQCGFGHSCFCVASISAERGNRTIGAIGEVEGEKDRIEQQVRCEMRKTVASACQGGRAPVSGSLAELGTDDG